MKIVKVDIFRIVPLCIKTKSEFSTSFPYRCGKCSDEGCGTISACCETFAEFRNALRSSVSVPQKFHMFLRSSAYVMRSSACVMRRLEVRVVHKGGQINNVQLITGLRIAEMSQLQNCSVMCRKNGSYCENEKKREKVMGEGGCVQRMDIIVKRKKKVRGGVRVDVNGEVGVKILESGLYVQLIITYTC